MLSVNLEDDVPVVCYLAAFTCFDVSTRPVTIRVQHMLLPFLLVTSYEFRKTDDSPMYLVQADPLNAERHVA
ncbi:uncharacterized protein N7525_001900 [Penicillium rubens]|uniref:uncharacterized protein n=1 Tax=Penicillium rubens TaxID=1108849 RepID=UPI002A5AB4C6|nr:uncharacterized protein N7525_001900 [Penicillium rubens]KAJ5844159.1 hypothetical protein N7525_001900 [Penicillium rubens]KAJ5845255.1 hypothetical protein N7534_008924 [Penicillium rubens]